MTLEPRHAHARRRTARRGAHDRRVRAAEGAGHASARAALARQADGARARAASTKSSTARSTCRCRGCASWSSPTPPTRVHPDGVGLRLRFRAGRRARQAVTGWKRASSPLLPRSATRAVPLFPRTLLWRTFLLIALLLSPRIAAWLPDLPHLRARAACAPGRTEGRERGEPHARGAGHRATRPCGCELLLELSESEGSRSTRPRPTSS